MSNYAAIIMAAGKGTRMKSDLPKVLHEILGRPMLAYVLDACRTAGVGQLCAVVGHKAEMVKEAFADASDISWVIQAEQHGTGHAVMCCEEALKAFEGHTIVLCGDAPLIRSETLKTLLETHEKEQSAITLATAIFDDSTGYGRIVRDTNGNIKAIVEQNDCTEEQAAIQEVNPSYYCFDNQVLFELLPHIKANNAKNEYYLTDIVGVAIAQGKKVVGVTAVQQEESMGINSKEQLAQIEAMMRERLQ